MQHKITMQLQTGWLKDDNKLLLTLVRMLYVNILNIYGDAHFDSAYKS